MGRILSILLVLFCLLPAAAFADVTGARVQETYKGIKGLRANFTQVLTHKESGSKENRTGVLEFKKPLLVRWETKTPSPELLVVGKKEIWNVFMDEEAAYKYPLSLAEDSRSIVRVITGQAALTQDFDVEPQGYEKGLAKLRFYPHEPTQSMTEGTLWVQEGSGLIMRVLIVDFYGNTNDITLQDLDVEVVPADKIFSYTPPKNFAIEDRTKDGGAPGKGLMQ